ncbi:MAG: ATP-binding cassette domain-containing protein [Clostridia bacterium]|nr:ATP-binding cassette domain-containing protein [Clostridia bacterium]
MITFNDIHLQWQYEQFELLKGISCTLKEGINTIVCDSQGGKTSICKLLTKVVSPTSGTITVNGTNLADIDNKDLDLLYLSANPTFFNGKSVLYNVCYPLLVRKLNKAYAKAYAMELLEENNLAHLAKTKVRKLSAQEKLLVSFVRGQTVDRQIVLLDDVFDTAELFEQHRLFSRFNQACTVILTSNSDLAQGNVITIDGGEIV